MKNNRRASLLSVSLRFRGNTWWAHVAAIWPGWEVRLGNRDKVRLSLSHIAVMISSLFHYMRMTAGLILGGAAFKNLKKIIIFIAAVPPDGSGNDGSQWCLDKCVNNHLVYPQPGRESTCKVKKRKSFSNRRWELPVFTKKCIPSQFVLCRCVM